MGRFSQFMARLEDIYALHDYATFAQSYQTAILGAKLVGFEIPSKSHAKRMLDATIKKWANAPLLGGLQQGVAQ